MWSWRVRCWRRRRDAPKKKPSRKPRGWPLKNLKSGRVETWKSNLDLHFFHFSTSQPLHLSTSINFDNAPVLPFFGRRIDAGVGERPGGLLLRHARQRV